jgi:hypothetical protein
VSERWKEDEFADVRGDGGTTGFGGEGRRWPKEGIGLVLVAGNGGREEELVEMGAIGFFDAV